MPDAHPPPLFFSTGQLVGNVMKGSQGKIRAGRRNHPAVAVMGRTDSSWGNELNLLPIKSK